MHRVVLWNIEVSENQPVVSTEFSMKQKNVKDKARRKRLRALKALVAKGGYVANSDEVARSVICSFQSGVGMGPKSL